MNLSKQAYWFLMVFMRDTWWYNSHKRPYAACSFSHPTLAFYIQIHEWEEVGRILQNQLIPILCGKKPLCDQFLLCLCMHVKMLSPAWAILQWIVQVFFLKKTNLWSKRHNSISSLATAFESHGYFSQASSFGRFIIQSTRMSDWKKNQRGSLRSSFFKKK